MVPELPPESIDRVIDHLHDSPSALASCSLVATPWVSRSRIHLFGEKYLCWAASRGDMELVVALLGRSSDSLNVKARGDTPLGWAARGGHKDVVKLLLEKEGIQGDSTDSRHRTPLAHAAQISCVSYYNAHPRACLKFQALISLHLLLVPIQTSAFWVPHKKMVEKPVQAWNATAYYP